MLPLQQQAEEERIKRMVEKANAALTSTSHCPSGSNQASVIPLAPRKELRKTRSSPAERQNTLSPVTECFESARGPQNTLSPVTECFESARGPPTGPSSAPA
jgi:hypothetical protein